MPPKLSAHLEECGCLSVLYMSSWLLTVFASAFPLSFASRVMDVLLTDSYSEPMMKVHSPLHSEQLLQPEGCFVWLDSCGKQTPFFVCLDKLIFAHA